MSGKAGVIEQLRPLRQDAGEHPVALSLPTHVEIVAPVHLLDLEAALTVLADKVGKLSGINVVCLTALETVAADHATVAASNTIKKDRVKRDGHPHRSEVAVDGRRQCGPSCSSVSG